MRMSAQKRLQRLALIGAAGLFAYMPAAMAQDERPTPAGYWEGSVTARETPMKDGFKTLTRTVDAEFWFSVEWDRLQGIGTAVGEAEAIYDAELKVENLPKVTAPVPGGSISFEPEVGGKLTNTDNRRRFPIVGVLSIDPETGQGTLVLQKAAVADQGSQSEQLDAEARGVQAPDAPMEFTLRADPGVSGGYSGAAGSLNYEDGRLTAESGGVEQGADVGGGGAVIVKTIPMKPFSPFSAAGGKVEKRAGGPFVASFEEEGDSHAIEWSAKQMGGERTEERRLTPEMRQQVEEMIREMAASR